MSKGTILSGGTGGQYSVAVALDDAAIAVRITVLESRLASLQADITTAEGDLEDLEDVYSALLDEQNALIDAFAADPTKDNLAAINDKTAEAAEAAAAVGTQRARLAALVADEASTRKEITRLSAAPATVTTSAWCADLTEDLAGDVGLIEVPGGERGQHLQIRPGHGGAAAYSAARDGMLRQPFADVPAATTYNLAMLPGWQKWLPRYRLAEINSIDTEADTCTLTIAAATSGEQGIGVNHATAYSDVPIEYMNCNAQAFAVGDAVLVEFVAQTETGVEGNWAAGKLKVIGFAASPKPCARPFGFAWNSGAAFISFAGTESAPSPSLHAGNRDWLSPDGLIHVSWDGEGSARYYAYPYSLSAPFYLYANGDYIRYSNGDELEFPELIAGAAYNAADGMIYVASHIHIHDITDWQSFRVYKVQAHIDSNNNCTIIADGPISVIDEIHWSTSDLIFSSSAVAFNGSANKCAFTSEGPFGGLNTEAYDLWEAAITPSSVTLGLLLAHTVNVRYYLACDYKGDTLVYSTIEPYDGVSKCQIVHYGVNIPPLMSQGRLTATKRHSYTSFMQVYDLRSDILLIVFEYANGTLGSPPYFGSNDLYYKTPLSTDSGETSSGYGDVTMPPDGALSHPGIRPKVFPQYPLWELATHYDSGSYVLRHDYGSFPGFNRLQEVSLDGVLSSVDSEMTGVKTAGPSCP